MSNTHRSGWSYIGEGAMWFLIFVGFGGCMALSTVKITHRPEPRVEIKDNAVITVK